MNPKTIPAEIQKRIEELHREACARDADSYVDPQTGYRVFTENYLRRVGHCCESGCRHCPYRARS